MSKFILCMALFVITNLAIAQNENRLRIMQDLTNQLGIELNYTANSNHACNESEVMFNHCREVAHALLEKKSLLFDTQGEKLVERIYFELYSNRSTTLSTSESIIYLNISRSNTAGEVFPLEISSILNNIRTFNMLHLAKNKFGIDFSCKSHSSTICREKVAFIIDNFDRSSLHIDEELREIYVDHRSSRRNRLLYLSNMNEQHRITIGNLDYSQNKRDIIWNIFAAHRLMNVLRRERSWGLHCLNARSYQCLQGLRAIQSISVPAIQHNIGITDDHSIHESCNPGRNRRYFVVCPVYYINYSEIDENIHARYNEWVSQASF